MAKKSRFSVYNFVQVTPTLATSGVVPAKEFSAISEAGYRTVINLLPDDNQYAVRDEEVIVSNLGMQYVHIPIDMEFPTTNDYELFSIAMDAASEAPAWVHCAANWRVSAFVGLYAQLNLGWSRERAEKLVASIWDPTPAWIELMEDVLSRGRRTEVTER